MTTSQRGSWWERLEEKRRKENEPIRDVAGRMGVSQTTLYNWRDRGRPESAEAVRALSEYLHEDFSQLWAEMRREPDEGMNALLRTYAARDFNSLYVRAWRSSLAAVLDPLDPAGVQLIDIIFRQLRRKLPSAVLSVCLMSRGDRNRKPFHYAIHVRDDFSKRKKVKAKLEKILRELRLPASFEHSKELLPRKWQDGFPVILVPVHLAAREMDWAKNKTGPFAALVLGVWYAGAPDIASEAAWRLGAGSDSITNLAAIAGSWDPASARTDRQLKDQQVFLAQRITGYPSPYSGPFIWANNDVPPILDPQVLDNLIHTFRGPLVIITLDDQMLNYAAFRSHTADQSKSVQEHRDQLSKWQDDLQATINQCKDYMESKGEQPAVFERTLRLPEPIKPQVVDGEEHWDDAVDVLFDEYIDLGAEVADWLLEQLRPVPSTSAQAGP